jgi:DNA-binding MarR family transcriptional regulator
MGSADKPVINSQIYETLMRTINRIVLARRVLRTYGEGGPLTMIESEMCWLISKQEGIPGIRLAEHLGVTRSATSQFLSKLREKGLVEAGLASSDGRVRGVWLTEKGRKAAKVAKRWADRMEEALFDASPEELEHYLHFVTKLEAYHLASIAEMESESGGTESE